MTDQTPSTEDVLDAVTEYGKQCVDAVESFRCATPDLEDVRNALAARDREVAAQALRDAAEDMARCRISVPWHWNLSVNGDPDISASPDVWLRFRADRIGAGDE